MIHLTHGDILKLDAEALVNTVNCMGVMGRGIALQFRRAFEDNYEAYRKAAKAKEICPGRMFVFERATLDQPRWIINFPTKRHWKGKSQIEDIQSGLVDLVRVIREKGIRSIAIPPLGCGLGGLDWAEVRPLIESAIASVPDVEAYLFTPGKAPAATEMVNRTRRPKLTTARAAVLALMQNYLAGLMDVEVSLLEIHKLMYFLQAAGEPLKLNFKPAPYGPYAENLRHVLSKLESHYIHGYGEGGDDPRKPIELAEGAGSEGQAVLRIFPQTLQRFDQVSRLIEGFESPFGMELLSTVHWVADRQGVSRSPKPSKRSIPGAPGRPCSPPTKSRRRGPAPPAGLVQWTTPCRRRRLKSPGESGSGNGSAARKAQDGQVYHALNRSVGRMHFLPEAGRTEGRARLAANRTSDGFTRLGRGYRGPIGHYHDPASAGRPRKERSASTIEARKRS